MGKLFPDKSGQDVTLFAFNTAYNTAFNTLINPDHSLRSGQIRASARNLNTVPRQISGSELVCTPEYSGPVPATNFVPGDIPG